VARSKNDPGKTIDEILNRLIAVIVYLTSMKQLTTTLFSKKNIAGFIPSVKIFSLWFCVLCCGLFVSSFSSKSSLHCENCSGATWGFFGHKKINELSIYTLPPEMFGFYKANMDYLIEHAVDPDKRRYGVKGEAECHYIDMDHYCPHGETGCNPFDNVPRKWNDALEKFGEDSLRAHGIVPWNIQKVLTNLTYAFKRKDKMKILRLSAELGHYIGDAHVPLHSTSNYNGQLTNQRGIHGFWESRLPELYSEDYDFFVGRADYISSPLDYIWDRVAESFAAVDSVLTFESNLNASYPSDQKYSFETRGQVNTKVYSEDYSRTYSDMLDNQVERRMRLAILSIGSYWYTAWVNGGQPDLNSLLNEEIPTTAFDSLAVDSSGNSRTLRVRDHE
jgi:hypothetical protein